MRAGGGEHRLSNYFRVGSTVAGVVVLSAALLVDRLGLGSPGSLGIGQVLLGLAGVALVLMGLLGRKFTNLYVTVATSLLGMVVLLGALELGSIVVARFALRSRAARIENLPYYKAQEWTSLHWREARQAEAYRYEPYLLWRHRPFSGQTVNFDESGHRTIPGPPCKDGDLRVFSFGGSTMLGWGSPDWGTIPAYLQQGLHERFGDAVCVVNLAEDGFVSTQSVIALALELQSGNIPDFVVFYDGVNDVLAAHESGRPRAHVTLAKIASRFEEREHPLLKWYKSSRQYALLERWVIQRSRGNLMDRSTVDPGLPQAVATTYLANLRLVKALAESYQFEFFFFLQPHLGAGDKVLAPSERQMLERMDDRWLALGRDTYRAIQSLDTPSDHLRVLSDVFDEERGQIWIDEAGHVTPQGNELVARAIVSEIADDVESLRTGGCAVSTSSNR